MTRSEAGKLGYLKIKEAIKLAKEERIKKYLERPTLCKCCDEPLEYKKRSYKFCSRSCSVSSTNTKRSDPNMLKNQHGHILRNKCLNCEKQTKHKFCSSKCNGKYFQKLNYSKILEGKCSSSPTLKNYLIKIRGYMCEVCKNSEWMGLQIPLTLDHCNGDPSDNNLNNLRLLCPNCHAQTPTYTGRNRGGGKGREHRKERYKNNKEKKLKGRVYC